MTGIESAEEYLPECTKGAEEPPRELAEDDSPVVAEADDDCMVATKLDCLEYNRGKNGRLGG